MSAIIESTLQQQINNRLDHHLICFIIEWHSTPNHRQYLGQLDILNQQMLEGKIALCRATVATIKQLQQDPHVKYLHSSEPPPLGY